MTEQKSEIRAQVWSKLQHVALPDSRFHFDFGSFIADFHGSSKATLRLREHQSYKTAKTIFVTPDNCTEELRRRALEDGKLLLVTTYAIRRGFWLLDPRIPADKLDYAATLDGLETMGEPATLETLRLWELKIDLMVTGTGAINMDGVRFGKGHGFFDLEWAMLFTAGLISQETQTMAIVHDCQVLGEQLSPEEFDTACDFVVTPTRVLVVPGAKKPVCGILWEKLAPGMFDSIPPLQELRRLIDNGTVKQPDR